MSLDSDNKNNKNLFETIQEISSPFLFLSFTLQNEIYSSLLENSFDKYRLELTNLLQILTPLIKQSNYKQNYLRKFQKIFQVYSKEYLLKIPFLWEKNENILKYLLNYNNYQKQRIFTYCLTNQPTNFTLLSFNQKKHVSSYNNFHQLLIHLERDWGSGGRNVRQHIYFNGIIPLLQKYLPINNSNHFPHILVPGAGLGRLAVELAVLGYRVEANECSDIMINVLYSILTKILTISSSSSSLTSNINNHINDNENNINENENNNDNNNEKEEDLKFYPYLHFSPMDEWNHFDRFKPSYLGNFSDSKHITDWLQQYSNSIPLLTIQSGDFLSIYSPDSSLRQMNEPYQENSFDCIITSFFIDTSTDIFDYLLTLRHLLKPGGIWINSGPLHYHTITSTPYSYHQLEIIIQTLGFIKLENKVMNSSYCGEENFFMKPEYYQFPIDVWKLQTKNDKFDDISDNQDTNEYDEEFIENIDIIDSKRFILKIKR